LELSMNLVESLNIKYFRLEGDRFEAQMDLTPFHSQPFGLLHGGATTAFAETVAGLASNELIDGNKVAVGQNIVTYHFKPKKIEGHLRAHGVLMHKGRTSHVWQVEMHDENLLLISSVIVTNAIIVPEGASPPAHMF
jgi:1,4-dihydroxy-2-naphthoyl-CoA hydrolase